MILSHEFPNNMSQTENKMQAINLEQVIAKKNPKLAKRLPKFILRYLKKIIHVDEINEILAKYGHLEGYDFLDKTLEEMNVSYEILQIENLPASGRFIIASNHPLGGFDGLVLIQAMQRKYGEVRFLVNDILMNLVPFRSLFVPINKHGGQARDGARILDEVLNSQMQVLIFPAGLASRKIKGKVIDLEWKKTFISKAVAYQRDVIPVFFEGQNSNFFYRLAAFRKFLRLKANIEMLYLPDETFKRRNSKLRLVVGKPIPYSQFTPDKTQTEWALHVREKVYDLQNQLKQ